MIRAGSNLLLGLVCVFLMMRYVQRLSVGCLDPR